MDADEKIREAFDGGESVELPPEMIDEPLPPEPPAMDPPEEGEAPEVIGARFPLNDFGNGCRLLHYSGEDLLFVPRLGWFTWTGDRWYADEDEIKVRKLAQSLGEKIELEIWHIEISDEDLEILRAAKRAESELEIVLSKAEIDEAEAGVLRRILAKADPVRKSLTARRKAHRNHARAAGNSGPIKNMMLESSVSAAIEINALNADPLAVNTEGGTLRFSKYISDHDLAWEKDPAPKWHANLEAHDRAHLISKICPVVYAHAATAPRFMAFLEHILPDPEIRNYLKRWFGYSLTGLTGAQKLAFLYGGGRNGKSTLVEIIARIVGDYGTTLPIESLTGTEQRKGSDATPDLVRLPGARMVRASEPDQGQRMKEALIKALTGGEAILIRRMMKEFVEITPEFKLTISGNHKPEIRGSDDGIWRRVSLIPFQVQITDAEVDEDLKSKLWLERAGILNWMVEGALEYLEGGLQEPAAVLDATAQYRLESDPYRMFLDEHCEMTENPKDRVLARELGVAFNTWHHARGEGVYGVRTVGAAFKSRAGSYKDSQGRTYTDKKISLAYYLGIKLSDEIKEMVEKMELEVGHAVSKARQ